MPDLGRFWTIPNVFSLLRPILAVVCMLVIFYDGSVIWSLD